MQKSGAIKFVLFAIFAAYACARVLEVFSGSIPHLWIVALDVFSAAAFAFADGSRRYGWRGMLMFAAICLAVGNLIENVGVATGFPYGRYRFLELMGPKIGHVPLLLGLAYVGMAYVSWMLARMILNADVAGRSSRSILVLPLLASLIMTTWDVAQDPVWATILHGWIWYAGGAWFGVPLSNYFGWYSTLLIIYLLFALYLRRSGIAQRRIGIPESEVDVRPSWLAPLFYALCAAGNVLQLASHSAPAIVTDLSGKAWHSAQILGASAAVSAVCMGAFVLLACRNSLLPTKSVLPLLSRRSTDAMPRTDQL
jgi:uncharacterized membrane protein